MKSKTAFYNRGILRSDLRRLWWAPALMTLFIFFDQPMSLLNQLEYYLRSDLPQTMQLYHGAVLVYYCYPVLVSALLFRYLHTQKATQFFHTLPLTRGELLRTKLITLWLFTALPTLINWAAVAVLYHTTPLSGFLKLSQVNAFFGGTLCSQAALCGFSLFAVTITGNTAGMIVAALGFPTLPTLLLTTANWGLEAVLTGFAGFPEGLEGFIYDFIPSMHQLTWRIAWFSISEFVLLTLVGAVLYRFYAVERAGDLITVTWMRPLFLYGVTFCATMTGLAYAQSNYYPLPGTIFTALLAAALGFYIAEALLKRTLRILYSWKKFAAYLVVAAAAWGIIVLDPIGYQTKVPKPEDVAAVSYGMMPLPTNQEKLDQYYYHSDFGLFTQPENIELVTQLHTRAIHQKGNRREMNKQYITYLMKDGSTLKRAYDMYPGQDDALLSTKEARISSNYIFRVPEEDILYATIYVTETETDSQGYIVTKNRPYDNKTIRSPEQLNQLREAVMQDLLEQDLSEEPTLSIDFTLKKERITDAKITTGTHTIEMLNALYQQE